MTVTRMRVVATDERTLEEALSMAVPLVTRARDEQAPQIAASVVAGPALVLSALQRAGRVTELDAAQAAGVRVLRRTTTGTAVYIGKRAILWTLALPHVTALAPDATPRTLLNRNVRGFLKGLSRAGALAHYFGREWISVKHRPAALLGFDASPDGAVLIEVFAGIDAPIAVPQALATDAERDAHRWLGKEPAALGELIGGAIDPVAIAKLVLETIVARAAMPAEATTIATDASVIAPITRADDPVPSGFSLGPMTRAPIGWIETALDTQSGKLWLGGDVLAPAWALHAIAEAVAKDEAPPFSADAIPIDGATLDDLLTAARAARGRAPPTDV